MTGGRALILAGTGMLPEVAGLLVRLGWHVVLPSRRYSPIDVPAEAPRDVPEPKPGMAALKALRRKGHLPQQSGHERRAGRAIWVEASWDTPAELTKKAKAALGGPADLLVAWVHGEYRSGVMRAVAPLLAATASVVEVLAAGVPEFVPEPALPAHPSHLILLGTGSDSGPGRPPSRAEVADGVTAAVRRALDGQPTSVHQIGLTRPMVR